MFKQLLILYICLFFSSYTHAEPVPYVKDPYAQEAPQEIVKLAQEAAELMGYKDTFEVLAPKKTGIEVNPWNKFIAYGRNPTTQNLFILVNPEWFLALPHEQQLFLLARCFAIFQESNKLNKQFIPFLFLLLSILLVFLIYWFLGKIFVDQQEWIRISIALGKVFLANTFIFNNVQLHIIEYLNSKYDMNIIKKVIEKTGNKEAATNAFHHFDNSIKEAIKQGEPFFMPYSNLFEKYAHALND